MEDKLETKFTKMRTMKLTKPGKCPSCVLMTEISFNSNNGSRKLFGHKGNTGGKSRASYETNVEEGWKSTHFATRDAPGMCMDPWVS